MTTILATDGDSVTVRPYRGAVAYLDSPSCPLDREGTVRVIEALTGLVESHDAAEKAREDRKLKRGDIVRPSYNSVSRYTVIRDEDADGTVDVVRLGNGAIRTCAPARSYRRFELRDVAPF